MNRIPLTQTGFTLLELLVVVLIIGLISGLATLSVGSVGNDRRLKTEAQRIVNRFSLAMQESILQGRPVGVTLRPTGYGSWSLCVMAGQYRMPISPPGKVPCPKHGDWFS
ncbi:MAG: prepilin-type N-terminal cleavage/methylation domain-containing protein [Sedimenticola sp.]